jgi:hypothetical protein
MGAQRTGKQRTNALRHELVTSVRARSSAPAEVVYDLLADLPSHLEWGGERQSAKTRLVSVDAPDGPATIGTEFRTIGADHIGEFRDSSVVTEATRPSVFEFVTEARLTTKKRAVADWTNIHCYQIVPDADGCTIAYTVRVARISALPGPLALFNIPGLSRLALKGAAAGERRGIRNLARLAEERTGSTRR